ncbi:hypothetical protein V6R21_12090 [Limibacter armeniacum]|uniref:hypothetical protein n=1 Tax=Limibacter armeniacum TaxID=466084 RepID=UPI002FE5A532
MKKFAFYFLAILFAGLMSSCDDDSDPLPSSNTLSLTTDATPANNTEVSPGDNISIDIEMSSSDRNLEEFTISRVIDGTSVEIKMYPDITDTSGSDDELEDLRDGDEYEFINNRQVTYTFNEVIGNETFSEAQASSDLRIVYIFTLTDGEGSREDSVVYTVPEVVTVEYGFEESTDVTLTYTGASQSDGANENSDAGLQYISNPTANDGRFGTFEAESDLVEIDEATYNSISGADEESFGNAETAYNDGDKVASIDIASDANFVARYILIKKSDDEYSAVKFIDLVFAAGNNVATIDYKVVSRTDVEETAQ